jgi:predicted DNA-binding transcriptional regulator AlpA
MTANLITIEELSKRLRKSVKTIQNDRCRNPSSLPPAIKFPGTRRVLFLESDVDAHILKFREIQKIDEPQKKQDLSAYAKNANFDKRNVRGGRPTNKSKMMAK